jgi:two-component system, OmpR family, phosphate regulon sensor histidine kinase PhoR
MIATIILITGFQSYWLTRLYKDEKQGLKKEADVLFRAAVYNLQMYRFRNDTLLNKTLPENLFVMDALNVMRKSVEREVPQSKMVISMSSSFSNSRDSSKKKDSTRVILSNGEPERRTMMAGMPGPGEFGRIIFRSSLGDSLSERQIDSAYRKELDMAKIPVSFIIVSRPAARMKKELRDSEEQTDSLNTSYITVGLNNPIEYRAQLGSANNYLLGKITYPILISLLLITLTTASFIFLYRNLLAQRRLTDIKNDFISNITHELKTPIATVNVAIEALKSFNAIDNPERTREYLDISSSELQRLSLLVDKVLKLSLFESKDIELKLEVFNLKDVIREVIQTMQLQFNKAKADVHFTTEGNNFIIEADKLHITSVVYNLLDNALKYSPGQPNINITLTDKQSHVEMKVADNGIGIPLEYQDKIFDKFFRVPHGNKHNIKGYGLGLSYVSHIISKHHGYIEVDSEEGKGSTFVVNLPFKEVAAIDYDNGRKVIKQDTPFDNLPAKK